MGKAAAVKTPTVEETATEYRIFRQCVDGNGQPWDSAARQRTSGTPTIPANPWPWSTMTRESAVTKIEEEQAKFAVSGFDQQLGCWWARNEATREGNGDLVIWRWRLVDWN